MITPDNLTPVQRSWNMSRIRSTGGRTTEKRLRNLFREEGITGWRAQYQLPGRPDFAFPSSKVAVFIDGCFWHGCRRCYVAPKSNVEYWSSKVQRNRQRDTAVNSELRSRGWKVIRIKEHTLKNNPRYVARRILDALTATGIAR